MSEIITYEANGVSISFDTETAVLLIKNIVPRATNQYECPVLTALEAFGFDIRSIKKIVVDFPDESGIPNIINEEAFCACSSLESIELPQKITIGDKAFAFINNECFSDVIYNGTLTTWNTNVTFGRLVDGERIITDVDTTLPLAKAQHFYLKSIVDNEEVLQEVINDLDLSAIGIINTYSFAYFKNIESIKFSPSLITIGESAFYNCTKIKLVDIPRGTQLIKDNAFKGCTALETVFICCEDIKLENKVFEDCNETIFKIYFEGKKSDFFKLRIDKQWPGDWLGIPTTTAADTLNYIVFGNIKYSGCTDFLEGCSGGLYWQQDFEDNISITGFNTDILYKDMEVLEDKTTCFYNWFEYVERVVNEIEIKNYLLKITIPAQINNKNVTKIAGYAFAECYKANIISIPETVTTIEDFAFYRCGNLMRFEVATGNTQFKAQNIPESLIGASALSYSYLARKNNTNSIIRYCAGCPNETFLIDANIREVGTAAFEGSLDLQRIIITLSHTNLHFGTDAFYDCTKLNSVMLNITLDAFPTWSEWTLINFDNPQANPLYYAKYLYNNITDKQPVNEIAINTANNYVFYNCKNLKKVIISTANIGKNAFYGCSQLTDVEFTAGVALKSRESAFENCNRLDNIAFKGSFEQWCKSSFDNDFANPVYYDINHTYDANQRYFLHYKKELTVKGDQIWLAGKQKKTDDSYDYFKNVDTQYLSISNPVEIPDCTFMVGNFLTAGGIIRQEPEPDDDTIFLENVTTIGKHAFEKASFPAAITTLKVLDSQHFKTAAFRGTNIPNIKITGDNATIESYAFAETTQGASGTLFIGSTNIILEDNCFYKSNFEEITLPLKYLSKVDLAHCKKLTLVLDGTPFEPDIFYSATKLEELVFEIKQPLSNSTLCRTLGILTSESFKYCPNLSSININNTSGQEIPYFTSNNCLLAKKSIGETQFNELVLGCNFTYDPEASAYISNIDADNLVIKDNAFAYRLFTVNEAYEEGVTQDSINSHRAEGKKALFALPKNVIRLGKDIFQNTKLRYYNTKNYTSTYE